jgi:hypothetical protein
MNLNTVREKMIFAGMEILIASQELSKAAAELDSTSENHSDNLGVLAEADETLRRAFAMIENQRKKVAALQTRREDPRYGSD